MASLPKHFRIVLVFLVLAIPLIIAKEWLSSQLSLDGMIRIPSGRFWMGCIGAEGSSGDRVESQSPMRSMDDCSPIHLVELENFWIDRAPVTNEEFSRFVANTGYVTVAERVLNPRSPGAIAEDLPGSIVFSPPAHPVPLNDLRRWWKYVPGANWRHPEGPESDLRSRSRHPAVHIAWFDADAYCQWAGKRLPTEAEFEYAARGGLDRKRYAWGDELTPGGKWMANTFQGHFPDRNHADDGFLDTSPIGSFPPNGYGLYDMTGNVWEWTSDWYRPDYYANLASVAAVTKNPQGPNSSFDPAEPGQPKKVQRGGSFLCSERFCARYLVGGRGRGDPESGASHTGFRCAR